MNDLFLFFIRIILTKFLLLFIVNQVYVLEEISLSKYLTEYGFIEVSDVNVFYKLVETIPNLYRLIFSFILIMSFIHAPHLKSQRKLNNSEKVQLEIDDGHRPISSYAIMYIALSTFNSLPLLNEFYNASKAEENPQAHGFNFHSKFVHEVVEIIFLVSKVIFLVWGVGNFVINNKMNTKSQDKIFRFDRYTIIAFLEMSVFVVGLIYSLVLFTVVPAQNHKIKDLHTEEFLKVANVYVPFNIAQLGEMTLSIIGLYLSYAAYYIKVSQNRYNCFSSSWFFRTVILGAYTTSSSSWQYHTHEIFSDKDHVSAVSFWSGFPAIYFIAVTAITGVGLSAERFAKRTGKSENKVFIKTQNLIEVTFIGIIIFAFVAILFRNLLLAVLIAFVFCVMSALFMLFESMLPKDIKTVGFRTMRYRVFHNKPEVLLWKLGNLFCIAALFSSAGVMFADLYHIEVLPGTIVLNVEHTIDGLEKKFEDVGEKSLSVLKHLDPCRWSFTETSHLDPNNPMKDASHYKYTLEGGLQTQTVNFKYSDYHHSKINCKCKTPHCIECDRINSVKLNITKSQNQKNQFVQSSKLGEQLDSIKNYREFTNDKTYKDHLKTCHTTECNTVLGIAIASELALLGGDELLSFIPVIGGGLSALASSAAWVAEKGNRVAHGIIKFGYGLAKFLTGFFEQVWKMRNTIFKTLKLLARSKTMVYVNADEAQLLLYAPIIVQGLFSLLVTFIQREDTHTAMAERNLFNSVGIPLLTANLAGTLFVSFMPTLLNAILAELPEKLIKVNFVTTFSERVLLYSFITATMGSALLWLSILLTSLRLQKKTNPIQIIMNKVVMLPFYTKAVAFALCALSVSLSVVVLTDIKATVRVFISVLEVFFILIIIVVVFHQRGSTLDNSYKQGKITFIQAHSEADAQNRKYTDKGFVTASLISIPILVLLFINTGRFVQFFYAPTELFIGSLASTREHARSQLNTENVNYNLNEGLCGLIGEAIEEGLKVSFNVLTKIFDDVENGLKFLLQHVEEFLHLANIFDTLGKASLSINHFLTSAEFQKVFPFFLPLVNLTIMLGSTIYLPTVEDKEARKSFYQTILSFLQIIVYQQIMLLIVVHSVTTMAHQLNLFIVHISIETGDAFAYAIIATAFNIVSIAALYVEQFFPSS